MEKYNLKEFSELSTTELEEMNGGSLIVGVLGLAGAAFYFGWELGREYARS